MRRRRGCRCRATSTSATKESGSTRGTPAATTESKKSRESVGMHESTSGSSSEGKQLKKRVTFGEPVVVGSPRSGVSGEGDGTVDSGQKVSGGGQCSN